MTQIYFLTLLSVLCYAAINEVEASCGQCQASNNVACHSYNVYSLCVDGKPTSSHISCPEGTICSDELYVCVRSEAGGTASCEMETSYCGICDSANKVFSCLDETTIAFCFGRDQPTLTALATCPPSTVCDLKNSQEFCSKQTEVEASCRVNAHTLTSKAPMSSPRTLPNEGQQTTTPITTTTNVETTTKIPNKPILETTGIWETTTTDAFSTPNPETITLTSEPVNPTTTTDVSSTLNPGTITTDASSTSSPETTTLTSESVNPTTTTEVYSTLNPGTTTLETTTDASSSPIAETTTGTSESVNATTTTEVYSTLNPGTTTTDISSTLNPGTTTLETTTDISSTPIPETTTTTRRTTKSTTTKTTPKTTRTTTQATTTTKKVEGCEGRTGVYENVHDPTCESFYYCVRQNGNYIGSLMYCDSDFPYFSAAEGSCVSTKPANCI